MSTTHYVIYAAGILSWYIFWDEIKILWQDNTVFERVAMYVLKLFILNIILGILIFSARNRLDAYAWQNPLGTASESYLDYSQGIGMVWFFVESVLVAPPLEELFFRIAPLWLTRKATKFFFPLWSVAVFTSILFALVHRSEPAATLYYFTFGLMNSVVYIKTKSKLTLCLTHSSRNLLGVLAILFFE